MKRSASCMAVVAMLVWAAGAVHAFGDEAFDRKLIGFAEAAKSAVRARDFAAAERIRSERLAMLSAADGDSPWRAGAAAIEEAGKRIDRLDYRGACETLRAAWRPFGSPAAAASPAGVLGDVAMKLFEATQAALAFHPRCLDDGNPERIATRDELRAALRIAVDRDPCAVEARAALAFLTRPEPKEAFLRAEARPSVQARNRLIGEIAYEGAGPVMPWHAPVELLRAGNLAFVLDDLDFCRTMLDRGPGSRIKGWDARHRPFDVLPNSHLLMRLGDEEGVEAPSVLFLASRGAASRGSKAEWRKLDLHLCEIVDGRLPAPASQAGDAARRPSVGRAASDHRLGPFRLRLVRQPSGLTADSVETLPVLAVDSLKRLEAAIEDAEKALAKNPAVPPAVLMPAEAVLHAGADVVRPPQRMGRLLVAAVDLDALARRGTLLVAAQASKPVAEPPFCQLGDGAGGEGAKRGQAEGSLYTQGLVTMALCRGYGLSRDVTLAEPAQLAIDFIAAAQDPVGGGWRYTPKQPGDTSVLGWQFQALADGAAAGLKVKPEVVKKAVAFLDAVQGDDSGTTYGYVPGSKGGKATTAIGLFVRSRTGWSVGDKRLLAGNKKLVEIGPTKDLYFDYYATHSLHASEDPAAAGWRKAMREMLAKNQATEGDDRGSWYDGVQDGAGVPLAGRLYCTSLAAMILEVTAVPTADLGGLANDRLAVHLPR
jgi:hypothetical protein